MERTEAGLKAFARDFVGKVETVEALQVVQFNYRGVGESQGKATAERVILDVDAVIQWLLAQGVTYEQMVLVGHSFGGAVAFHAAKLYPEIGRVLVASTFTSILGAVLPHLGFVVTMAWKAALSPSWAWWALTLPLFFIGALIAFSLLLAFSPFLLLALLCDWNMDNEEVLKELATLAPGQKRLLLYIPTDQLIGSANLGFSPAAYSPSIAFACEPAPPSSDAQSLKQHHWPLYSHQTRAYFERLNEFFS